MNFSEEAKKEIFSNLDNNFEDNWDYTRFGNNEHQNRKNLRSQIQRLLNKRGYYHVTLIQQLIANSLQISKFEYLYDNLISEYDKKLLLRVLAYRVLGHRKVKLPLNTPEYWAQLKLLEDLSDTSETIDPNFLHVSLHKINLTKINYPIEFYFTPGGALADFVIRQYEYNKNETIINAEKGDYVIDGGGCWGDTALYFANEVGKEGKVFSFEFIPNNIKIFETNTALNEELEKNIELIKNPLWKDSTTKVYFKDFGPGSKVSMIPSEDLDGECYTACIDDLVARKGLRKIDFIKMDIEGAEMNALKGASVTIQKFKPKLAIALYHSADDFERIPQLIRRMVPEYKFYFSHCSIHEEESILFAKVN